MLRKESTSREECVSRPVGSELFREDVLFATTCVRCACSCNANGKISTSLVRAAVDASFLTRRAIRVKEHGANRRSRRRSLSRRGLVSHDHTCAQATCLVLPSRRGPYTEPESEEQVSCQLSPLFTPSQSAFHHRKGLGTLIMQSLPPCLHPSRDQREAPAAGAAPALLKKTSHAAASSSSQPPS